MTATAMKGSKFLLRDIEDDEQKEEMKTKLMEQGWTQAFSFATCDIVITNTLPNEDLVQKAARFSKEVITFADAIGLVELEELPDLDAEVIPDLEKRSAFEISEDSVRILDLTIPLRGKLDKRAGKAEALSSFSHLCLDEAFLTNAHYLIAAAKHDIPCALEGETATAKTTVIRWLAALLGQPVYRINLNGQTDTSELVGRYVPSSGFNEIETETLLKYIGDFDQDPEWERVRKDLIEVKESIAKGEPRELNPVEKARLAKKLGFATKAWTFVEGLIPKALRYGAWVILDEMNLAEPQILERLNSVLEVDHTLVLTEGEDTRFGPGGDVPVHSDFRMFGTMNPAEYEGRNTLSPAFRDRWSLWRFVNPPTEADIHAMLRFLVFGEHPQFEFKGVLYQADASTPTYPNLQSVPMIAESLDRLATFHHTLASFSGRSGGSTLGRTRRERYQFTRRGLHVVMRLFNASITSMLNESSTLTEEQCQQALAEAIELIYVTKVQEGSDRNAVISAMRAAGLAK